MRKIKAVLSDFEWGFDDASARASARVCERVCVMLRSGNSFCMTMNNFNGIKFYAQLQLVTSASSRQQQFPITGMCATNFFSVLCAVAGVRSFILPSIFSRILLFSRHLFLARSFSIKHIANVVRVRYHGKNSMHTMFAYCFFSLLGWLWPWHAFVTVQPCHTTSATKAKLCSHTAINLLQNQYFRWIPAPSGSIWSLVVAVVPQSCSAASSSFTTNMRSEWFVCHLRNLRDRIFYSQMPMASMNQWFCQMFRSKLCNESMLGFFVSAIL